MIIPAFAVDRTEVILRTLRELRASGDIPAAPVLIDSPMALAALSIYQKAIAARSAELRAEILADGPQALDPGLLTELRTVAESMTANHPAQPSLIVSCGPGCSKRGHTCPAVKQPCPKGCTSHARECPQRTGGGWYFARRKGVKPGQGHAKLILALPKPFIKQLREHRKRQNAERLAVGSAWTDRDLVFCSPTGAPLDPHDDWDDWRDLLSAAGVREARVHDARHTAATLLLAQGTDIRVVQQVLGHSQLSQTQRYAHVTAELVKGAADRMGKALSG